MMLLIITLLLTERHWIGATDLYSKTFTGRAKAIAEYNYTGQPTVHMFHHVAKEYVIFSLCQMVRSVIYSTITMVINTPYKFGHFFKV